MLTGADLFGNKSTHLRAEGPAGSFMPNITGGFRVPDTRNDTIFTQIFAPTLALAGQYPVGVLATDEGGVDSKDSLHAQAVASPVQQNPLLSVPEAAFAQATSAVGANVEFFVGATSLISPQKPTLTCSQDSGDLFPLGSTTVNCTASDSFGSASESFTVFVLDIAGPVLTGVPGDIVTSNPIVTYNFPTALDAIDGVRPVTCSPASGATFALGTTTVVRCIAYDSQANAGIATFSVTVDTPLPQTVSVTASPNSRWPPNHQMVDVAVSAIAIELDEPAPSSRYVSGSSNQAPNGDNDGNTQIDWIITGPLTVQLRAERWQYRSHVRDNDREYRLRWQCGAGNGCRECFPELGSSRGDALGSIEQRGRSNPIALLVRLQGSFNVLL